MRLLLTTPQTVTEALGISRILIRLSEELGRMGHAARILGPEDLGVAPEARGGSVGSPYAAALRAYLRAHAAEYDVVEYDYEYLPFPRAELAPSTLMVARSVLLVQYLETVRVPQAHTPRAIAGRLLKGRARATFVRDRIRIADETLRNADLVNLANHDDKALLVGRGISSKRVAVIPYALSSDVRASLGAAASDDPPRDPVIVFIGTFDFRKGATHFGPFFERVVRALPNARLKLLGCKGLMTDAQAVLSFFPRALRSRVEVVMTFARGDLPALLADCSVGIFPSYFESFGLGVLEMMCARLPVVAFDAPGPPMMVPRDLLVPRADEAALAATVIALLRDPDRLRRERARARAIAEGFTWEGVARLTVEAYERGRARIA